MSGDIGLEGLPATSTHPRWPTALALLLAIGIEIGLVATVVVAAATGDWSLGDDQGAGVNAVGWVLVPVFVILLGLGISIGARQLRAGALVERVGPSAAWRQVGDRELGRIELETAVSLTYLPALRATWQTSGRRSDPRRRWTPAGVGHDRLSLEDRDGSVLVFSSTGRGWPDVVNALAAWTERSPDLAADDATRAFLAASFPPTRPRPARWAGLLACTTMVGVVFSRQVVGGGAATTTLLLSLPIATVVVGWLLWFGFVRGVVALAQGVVASVVRRDPWAPFTPDVHGRFNWLVGGRLRMLRAPARTTSTGLLWRWPLWVAAGVVPVTILWRLIEPLTF